MIPKFLAWDKKHNEMIRVVSINFDEKFVRGLAEVESNLDIESSYNFDEIEVLESTGLKDNCGNDIYEGQIVKKINGYRHMRGNRGLTKEQIDTKMANKDISEYELATIERKGAYFGVRHIGSDSVIPLNYNVVTKVEDLEVIGNIYQDAHLLNNN